MKKTALLFSLVAGLVSLPVLASADLTYFTTIAQAEQYCPAITGLTFTQVNPSVPNGIGPITGSHNGVQFVSYVNNQKANVTHPQCAGTSCIIPDATFRSPDGTYGHISGDLVTCFYSYTNFVGVQTALVMSGFQSSAEKN